MKRISTLAALALAVIAVPAHADFSGPYAPANWTTAMTGTLVGTGTTTGSATFSSSQLALIGGNGIAPAGSDGSCVGGVYAFAGPCQIQTTIVLPGTYSFHWSYLTADEAGPAGDIFGVLVNGVRTSLSDPGGAISQSGDRTFTASSSFGWFLNCTDCTGGAATATITNFVVTQPIPEPTTYALLAAGLAALGAMSRRRREAARATLLA